MIGRPGLPYAIATGLLYAAAFPPADLGWVAYVALVPLLLVALEPAARPGRTFLHGWLAGTIATALLVSTSVATAATRYFGLQPGAAWLAGLVAPQLYGAPYFGLFALLARAVGRRTRSAPVAAALGIAAAWVACDLLRARLGDGCPWVLLAHSQHARPIVLQTADLGGASAVSFVVALGNAALALAVQARTARRGTVLLRLTALLALVFGASALYGARQLARWSAPPGDTLRIGVVQGNLPDEWRYSLAAQPKALRRLTELTARIAGDAPDLVVWPENALSVEPATARDGFAAAAATLPAGALLLVGAPRAAQSAPGRAVIHNAAFLLDRTGEAAPVYDKLYLTPWAEGPPWPLAWIPGIWPTLPGSYTPGTPAELPALRGHRFGIAICAEAIHAGVIADQVRRGATFLVAIANDGWFADRPAAAQHADAALLRAVENRRALVRVTATGISTVVAPSGVVIGEIPAGTAGTLVAPVQPLDVLTVYTRLGDAFAWLCVLALAVVLARRADPEPLQRRTRGGDAGARSAPRDAG